MSRITRLPRVALTLLVLALASCSDPADTPTDAGMARDFGPADAGADTGVGDAGDLSDAASEDAGDAPDAGEPRDAATDTDASTPTLDAGACDYVAVDEVVVRCDMRYVFVSRFQSEAPGCAPFHGFDPGGPRFADAASAIASDPTCEPMCQWRFATSVSRIYCGRRSGYETLSAPDPACADLYRFAEGYYPSVEAHDAANPCM
jgi:hypothetical protein